MIKNGDTLIYEQTMEIHKDTMYFGNNTIYPGDTTYSFPCYTFEKRDGQIINQRTPNCLPVGFWIIEHENGTISKGNYTSNGKLTGIWKTYDKGGQLIKEIEYTSIGNDTYTLKEIHYKDGQATIVSKKTWFASFYLQHLLLISIILGVIFFSRVFINSPIYNRKNGTNYSPIYFHFGPIVSKNFEHSLMCTFTFWWSVGKLKEESRSLARVSNILSIIALGLFFGLIIGLGLSGELK